MPSYVRRRPGFVRDVSGAGLGEYALLVALIAGVSAIAVTSLGIETRGTFSQIADVTQEAGGSGGGDSGSGGTPGGSSGGGSDGGDSNGNGSTGSGGSGDGGNTPIPPGTPGENFAITLGSQALPPANRLSPWSFDFSSLVAFQDPGTVSLSNLFWSSGSPSLPSWMSLDASTGIASGTPDVAGEATFEVVASYLDAEGRQVFTLDIGGALIEAVQISVGSDFTCAVTVSGAAMCWGRNFNGNLGDGTTTDRITPVTVSGLDSGVASISAGFAHACAVTTTGAAMCWGLGDNGRLGDGGTTRRLIPVAVSGLGSGVVSIAAGLSHTCALTTSGAAVCWGNNSVGQLGDGTTTQRLTPVNVSGLGGGVASISTSHAHTCAVTTVGAAMCWGANGGGRLGDGSTTNRLAPVIVSGLGNGVASISAGVFHTCAITTSGAAMCWGSNSARQLGDGTITQRLTPVNVSSLSSDVASISAGTTHTCAVSTLGAAMCWGSNDGGVLGDGTTTNRSTPVTVSGLGSGVVSVSTRDLHTCVVTTTGAAMCWGYNGHGRLGDGTVTNRHTPVSVVF